MKQPNAGSPDKRSQHQYGGLTRRDSPERRALFQAKKMKTVSAKLYPTPKQERDLLRFLNVGRWVFNKALEHRIKAWKRRGESVQYNQQQAMLTGWRDRMEWLRIVPVLIERDALRRVDRGMKAFFRRVKAGQTPGFPRFKGRLRWRSFEVLQPGKYLRDCSRVYVPGIGPVRCRGMQEFDGQINGIRVIRKARGWYVQLIVDDLTAPVKPVKSRVGIDVGLTHFATLSTGEHVENPRWYRSSQRRLRFLQQRASSKVKGSNRRRKAYERVARFHERIADTRKDWTHKLSRRLVNEFDLIAVEDLNVTGMARSRFGKSILDAAWSEFAWQLSYKAESAGGTFVRVDPRGTSQECSQCGRAVPKTLRDRVHSCPCGCVLDRDHNAALNVIRRASPELTRGECTSAGPATRVAGRRGTLNREVVTTQRCVNDVSAN